MAKSTFKNSNINLQNTRTLSLSNHIPDISISVYSVESTFVFSFLKEGFNTNFPSFKILSVLSSDVLILYKTACLIFFFFMAILYHFTTITLLISPIRIKPFCRRR